MHRRHSYSRLNYHIVTTTKYREPVFQTKEDELLLLELLKFKARQLDAYIIEFGTWVDHFHILLQAKPSLALSVIYGQMKGFSASMWNKNRTNRPLRWQDGVFIESYSPQNTDPLRNYIRNQRSHHSNQDIVPYWESPEM